jgi:hypothetical protein
MRSFNWMLQNNCPAVKRDLFLENAQNIPVSEGYVLMSEVAQSRTLCEFQESYLLKAPENGIVQREELIAEARFMFDEEMKKVKFFAAADDETSRKIAMRTVIAHYSKQVPRNVINCWLWAFHGCGNSYFATSRTLASQLGTISALQFLIGAAPSAADLFSVSPSGLISMDITDPFHAVDLGQLVAALEANSIDSLASSVIAARHGSLSRLIRCSRLVTNAFSPSMLLGVTGVSMGASFDAFAEYREIVEVGSAASTVPLIL